MRPFAGRLSPGAVSTWLSLDGLAFADAASEGLERLARLVNY